MNLGKSTEVKAIIGEAVQNKLYVAAICAAPLFVIDKMEEFHGKNVCLFPDLAGELENTNYKEADVLVDGRLITGKGPSKAMKFALSILENVYGKAVGYETRIHPSILSLVERRKAPASERVREGLSSFLGIPMYLLHHLQLLMQL